MKKHVGFFDYYMAFFWVGLLSVGGGYTMLPTIIKQVVEKNQWATDADVLDSYALAQSVPGVVAINTAAFLGFRIGKLKTAIAFILGCITPSIVVILFIAVFYSFMADNRYFNGALNGILIAVLAMLVVTVIELMKKSIKDIKGIVLAITSFVCLALFHVSAVFVILGGICMSALMYYRKETKDGSTR